MIKFIFGDKYTAKNPLILKYVRVDMVNRSNKNILHSVNKPIDKSYGEVIQRWSTNSPKIRVSGTIVNKLFDDAKSALTIGAEAINQIPTGARTTVANIAKNTFSGKTSKAVENVRDVDMYPQEEIEELQRLLEYEGSIKVIHHVLNAQNINNLVVNTVSLPFTEGEIYQDFTINFLVDSYVLDDLNLIKTSEPSEPSASLFESPTLRPVARAKPKAKAKPFSQTLTILKDAKKALREAGDLNEDGTLKASFKP